MAYAVQFQVVQESFLWPVLNLHSTQIIAPNLLATSWYLPAMAPSATEMTVPLTVKKREHRSGDPNLAFSPDAETKPPEFEDKYETRKFLKHRLALAYRIFAQNGFSDGVAGHITVRDPVDPTSFWVNPFGKVHRLRHFLSSMFITRHSLSELYLALPFGSPRVRGGRVADIQGKGLHFSLITDDDLIRVDHDGKVVEGGNNLRLNYGTGSLSTLDHFPGPSGHRC